MKMINRLSVLFKTLLSKVIQRMNNIQVFLISLTYLLTVRLNRI